VPKADEGSLWWQARSLLFLSLSARRALRRAARDDSAFVVNDSGAGTAAALVRPLEAQPVS